jgi:hypothetical protein
MKAQTEFWYPVLHTPSDELLLEGIGRLVDYGAAFLTERRGTGWVLFVEDVDDNASNMQELMP